MTEYLNETLKYAEGLTKEMYEFVSTALVTAMKDESKAAVIVTGVVMLAVNAFRLNPAGFVATTILPLVVKALYDQYRKNQEEADKKDAE